MKSAAWGVAALVAAAMWAPSPASACGGFFCSQSPVDQASERIIFAINADGTTDMIVQIAYQGTSQDFAWLLPLASVPDPKKLATFPQLAMMALESGTGPTFSMHPDCQWGWQDGAAGGSADAGTATPDASDGGVEPPVTVYIRETVGPYDVAVIGSDDAKAASDWLQAEGYRISEPMAEYIKIYTAEKMKLLALKLTDEADVSEIAPFRLRLPGDSPNIPLRLTSIAAMPEMGIVAWVFADQRYEPVAPGKELDIDNSLLRWGGSPEWTNWKAVVARAVDEVDGKGWVVEQAGNTDQLRNLITSQEISPEDPRFEAQQALKELIEGKSYMTRLYTRLSPEEMTYDPGFKRSAKADVSRDRQLPYVKEFCDDDWENDQRDPCDFNACGSHGLCRKVENEDGQLVAACACAPGLTARATGTSDFGAAEISCIDERLSFLNPGDRDTAGQVLPDACAGFSCGEHGSCVTMNMTPTCECDQGYVAQARVSAGTTSMTCVLPSEPIPASFYKTRLEPRDLPTGREVRIVEVKARDSGFCSVRAGSRAPSIVLGLLGVVAATAGLRRRRRV